MLTQKTCSRCERLKPAAAFYVLTYKPTGTKRLSAYCRECQVKLVRSNKDSEAKKEYDKNYRQKNIVRIRATEKLYCELNKGRTNKYKTKFRKKKIELLLPTYVAENCAKAFKMTVSEVKQIPGLVETYKTQMLIKRKIKENGKK